MPLPPVSRFCSEWRLTGRRRHIVRHLMSTAGRYRRPMPVDLVVLQTEMSRTVSVRSMGPDRDEVETGWFDAPIDDVATPFES